MKENYNLFEYSSSLFMQNPSEMTKNVGPFFDKVKAQFCRILSIGVKNGEIIVDDLEETAEIILFALMGMRAGILNKEEFNNSLFPSPEEFEMILAKQQKMLKIFIRGLRT